MNAELITIGDELLYGHTLDTNAAFIGMKLAEAGIDLLYHTSVGDQADTILAALGNAMNRVDIILVTGGLGPTHDDITKKTLCKFFKRQLVFHEDVLKDLLKRYSDLGMTMPAVNQNQALLPQGAKFIENKIGSALGMVFEEKDKILIAMPGVPAEMKSMLLESVLPMLKQRGPRTFIVQKTIRTIGIMEAAIFEKVSGLIEENPQIKIAFLPGYKGVDIRFTAKSGSEEKARQAIDDMVGKFQSRIGKYIFGYDDDELPAVIGALLKERKLTLAVAESCTAGLIGKLLTDVPGSSEYFLGGIIAYANKIKTNVLNVPENIINDHGAVSAQTAVAMAKGVRALTDSAIGLSITGIAGPSGGTESKPVGLTYVGLCDSQDTIVEEFRYGTDRERNRLRAAYSALNLVRKRLLKSA